MESLGGSLRSVPFSSGKYEVVARLGRGGMAQVFLAVVRGMGGFNKLVVIKRLDSDDASFRRMFLDEARVAALLSHPNVVHTYEVSEHGGSYFIAMEYLDGQPLNKIVRRAQELGSFLNPRLCVRVVADALAGLHYAHELRDFSGDLLHVVHRDVSPHNLFVTHDGQVKIFDFGVAKAESRLEGTEVGVLKGKLGYMSPEQAAGENVDRRADVFSAGVVLWELLTLRQLVTRDSNASALRQVLHGPVPDLPASLPGVDAELRTIVARSLKRDKDQRYSSAQEMRAALASYLERHPFSQEDLAAFMHEHFETARVELQRRIQETIFPSEAADPVISITETEDWDPLLIAEADLPVLDSGSYSVAPREGTMFYTPGPEPEPEPPASISGSIQPLSRTPVPPAVHTQPPEPARAQRGGFLVLAAFVAVCAGWFAWQHAPRQGANAEQPHAAAAGSALAPAVLLRVHGSNTIGTELGPALAEAYLRFKGQEAVQRRTGDRPEATWVAGHTATDARAPGIEIRAEGSATAFSDLGAHGCDVGMSSRAIKPAEAAQLAQQGLGDLQTPAAEHVIGLDGIAVIVHPNNPRRSLDLEQLKSVFTGKQADWAALGGQAGSVHVYARDAHSGTYDTFQHLVLGDEALLPQAKRVLDSSALSAAVASDPQGIGFIGIPYVRGAKALAVAEVGAAPLYASAFTVSTEDYALSRRLYLYLPVQGASPAAVDFVNFALSAEGQKVVRAAGFVDLNVHALEPSPCDARCSPYYAAVTKGARRLSLDFRFRTGLAELDSRGQGDIERLIAFLGQMPEAKLMLLGFSDARGSLVQNQALAHDRAKKVEQELTARGVHASLVATLGQEMPISSNTSEAGRERNRRVEVWLR